MQDTNVKIVDAQLGELGAVPVRQDAEAPAIQVAASAYLCLQEATFQVGDETFTADDIQEWLA